MELETWETGVQVKSPAYIDTNLLVGALISGHDLYERSAQLFGEMLADDVELRVSVTTLHEGLWALAKLSYCELFNHPSNVHFSVSIYRKHRDAIFERFRPRMYSVGTTLKDWHDAGVSIAAVPSDTAAFFKASERIPLYMEKFNLAPGDATHLALAEDHAKTLLTADNEFTKVVESGHASPLTVLHVPRE